MERIVFALPVRLGGLGIINPVQQASHFYEASRKITSAPSPLLKEQAETIPPTIDETISQAKREEKDHGELDIL